MPPKATSVKCPWTCELTNDAGYVVYSALGSFYIPMFVMLFFYWRIYRAAIRTTRAINQGFRTTKGELMLTVISSDVEREREREQSSSRWRWRQLRMSGACCLYLTVNISLSLTLFRQNRLILTNMIWCLLMLQLCRRNDDACLPPPSCLFFLSQKTFFFSLTILTTYFSSFTHLLTHSTSTMRHTLTPTLLIHSPRE